MQDSICLLDPIGSEFVYSKEQKCSMTNLSESEDASLHWSMSHSWGKHAEKKIHRRSKREDEISHGPKRVFPAGTEVSCWPHMFLSMIKWPPVFVLHKEQNQVPAGICSVLGESTVDTCPNSLLILFPI
jgi:hypothetical protein